MKSRGSGSRSPDDDREEPITGIRYPPSWGQVPEQHHQSVSPPQGASREGSDESFHSDESHHGSTDYTQCTSLIL